MVTRPIDVVPTRRGPSHVKWSCQLSVLGWNSRVTSADSRFRPTIHGPLSELQCRHASARLSKAVGPACFSAMMGSI